MCGTNARDGKTRDTVDDRIYYALAFDLAGFDFFSGIRVVIEQDQTVRTFLRLSLDYAAIFFPCD